MGNKTGRPPGAPPEDKRCVAQSRQHERRCNNWRTPGHMVCRFHGSATRAAKAKARERQVETQVAKAIEKLNITPVDNPLLELKKLAGEVIAWKEAIKAHVEQLTKLRYETEMGGEQIRAEVVLFERALDRCAAVLGLIAKLNIDDRLATIEEAKVQLVVDAVEASLDELDIPVPTQAKAKLGVARRLRSAG